MKTNMFVQRFKYLVLLKRIQRKVLKVRAGKSWRKVKIDEQLAPRAVPKIIWVFWAQGEKDAPDIVKTCIESWRTRNPGWDIRVLDKEAVNGLTDVSWLPEGVSFSHYADIVRVRLLDTYGGVWVDATSFCTQPLNEWLLPLMQSGFFAFANPHPDRVLASWFMASEKNGAIVSRWSKQIEIYWTNVTKADHYLWLHYLFEWLTRTDRQFRKAWHDTPRISAEGPHLLRRCLDQNVDPVALGAIDFSAIPLHKLSWKVPFAAEKLAQWGIVRA